MKVFCVVTICCLAIVFLFPTAISSSFTIINSIGKDCESEHGQCIEVCEYEDLKLRPGTGRDIASHFNARKIFKRKKINVTLLADTNNTKCIAVFCSEAFTLTIHTCVHEEDPSGSCTYTHNYQKVFPDCCNNFCQSIVQLN
jgi:Single domain von Willebrand factor type C